MMTGCANGCRGVSWLTGRVLYVAVVALAAAALYVSLSAVSAEAQGVQDWDSVTEDKYDTPATDSANRDITAAQEERDEAIETEQNLDCALCVQARDAQEQREAANEATYAGTEALVAARAQAIVDAPADTQEQIEEKYDALATLGDYAEEWSPGGPNEGTADPSVVEDARAEVDEQAAEVEGSDSSGGGSSEGSGGGSGGGSGAAEDTAEDTAGGAAAGGSEGANEGSGGGGDGGSGGGGEPPDEGGSGSPDGGAEEGAEGGPLSGIASALSGSNLVALLAAALIGVGIIYYVGGLLREGIGARVSRVGAPQQASAPRQRSRGSGASSGRPRHAPEERRKPDPSGEDLHGDAGTVADRLGGESLKNDRRGGSEGSGGGDEGAGDSSALADRLGLGGRNPRRDGGERGGDGSSPEELNDLFDLDEDEGEGGDDGRQ